MASKVGKSVNASRTFSLVGLLLAPVVAFGLSTAPVGAHNLAPPTGAVMDLSGQSLPLSDPTYTSEPFKFSEQDITGDTATLTFMYRDDYAFINFSDVALYDLSSTASTVNLLTNGNFAGGAHASNGYLDIPIGWTYVNPNPVNSDVFVAGNCSTVSCVGTGQYWSDGTQGGYDGLSQQVKVNSQDLYQISFNAFVTGAAPPASNPTWAETSTNSGTGFAGNAADILAYTESITQLNYPGTVTSLPSLPGGDSCSDCPELSTWAMMLLGFAGLASLGYRRASALAS
jgi:hypothetical protein